MEADMKKVTEKVKGTDSDLSEQIKAVTKDSHVRAENTELMLSYQRGHITLPQYKLLLCSLYEIYRALEEELDRNSANPGVAPIYFPQELARKEALENDLEFLLGQGWKEKITVPVATHKYVQRLRQIGKENPTLLVPHAYTRYLGDLSGGQVLGRITQKSLGLSSGEGLSFFSFPGVTSPNRFKQLYRSRMNSVELTEEEREGVLLEAVRAFEFNIQVFDDLQKMLTVTEADANWQHRQAQHSSKDGVETVKNRLTEKVQISSSDLSEQIKAVTKDSHVRAENTELMLSYQRGHITLPQYKFLLCSLYEIYRALEEELDRNSSHPGVAPIYFPQELARQEALEKDLEFLLGKNWQERIAVPAATHRYTERLRQIGKENPILLVPHAYTRYLGDLSGGQVLGRITQKSLGLSSGEGLSFFLFPGVSSPNRFKQLYRSRMNSVELTEEEREGVLLEAVRAFEFNIQVFDDLQKMLTVTEADANWQHRQAQHSSKDGVETVKNRLTEKVQISSSDLSEQIKAVTKDSHVRAENTELMLSYQRGHITLPQYKFLLCSLYEIYRALEEELDRNSSHPGVAPIYFPQELARQEALEKDLEFLLGKNWQERIAVPAATHRYTERLRQIGKENPILLVAHAYTRYLGDLSGGQVLGRITQKSLGLSSGEGLSFFSFPGVSSPNRFKQLYRSRMNSVELTEEEREGVLEEAVRAFEFNIQVFDDLQKMLTVTEETDVRHRRTTGNGDPSTMAFQLPTSLVSSLSVTRFVLGVCIVLAVAVGIYLR